MSNSVNKEEEHQAEKKASLNILPRFPKQNQGGLSIGKKASENLSGTKQELEQTILLSVEDMETTVEQSVEKADSSHEYNNTNLNKSSSLDQLGDAVEEFATPQLEIDPNVKVLIPEDSDSFKESFRSISEEQTERPDDSEEQPQQLRHHKNEKPYSTKFFIKLLAVAACIVCALFIIGISKIAFTKQAKKKSSEQVSAATATDKTPSSSDKALERARNNIPQSIKLAEQFLNTKTTNGILKICRDPQRVKPAIEEYYQSNALNYSSYELDPEKFDIVQFGEGTATLLTAKTSNGKSIPICIVGSDSDNPVIDWESFVNLCETPWALLKNERPSSPVMMRAKLKPSSYFNFIYNEDAWSCYRMSDMEDQHFLYVYTQRNGETDLKIQEQLGLDNDLSEKRSMTSAVTKVYFEQGAGQHQARLDSILNFGTLLR